MRKRMGGAGLVAGLLAATLHGCVHATYIPTGEAYPSRSGNCDVQVFSSAPPERPYVELGIVEGEGDWWKADLEDILPRLKEEACLAGGDAIIMGANNRYAEGEDGIRVQHVTATVIRWRRR